MIGSVVSSGDPRSTVRLVQDTFEICWIVVTCTGGGQGVGISPEPLLVVMVMEEMTDVILQDE